jgi:transcriptional regulator with XRE-family HTH domain
VSTIHDPRYSLLVENLKSARQSRNITQASLAKALGQPQPYVAKVETLERRLDIIELFDWLDALDYSPQQFFQDIGWFPGDNGVAPLPIKGAVEKHEKGVLQHLLWQGQIKKVLLEGISEKQYLSVEAKISDIFASLNLDKPTQKNREAIVEALELAVKTLPNLNPSDIYQHIIYRLYLREYRKSKPEQSWVRAGGEAMELFVERHYSPVLKPHGIHIKALLSGREKAKALQKMGLSGTVGDSKLDVALYGEHNNSLVIFGGVHSKASLAERVSDDVPCSEAMIRLGLSSFLYTFDSKSFPPPNGDLVNRGELGSHENPSDKRKYIEEHGSFDCCFSYNLRSNASKGVTRSGKKIYVCSLNSASDEFPKQVISAWKSFKSRL